MRKNTALRKIANACLGIFILFALSGCSNPVEALLNSRTGEPEEVVEIEEPVQFEALEKKITQIKDSETIELGSDFSFVVEDYFAFENITSSELIINNSMLDIHKLGRSDIVVTYLEDKYLVSINVIDTIAPELDSEENIIITNSIEDNYLLEAFGITAQDFDEVVVSVDSIEYYGDFSVLDEKPQESSEEQTEEGLEEVALESENPEEALEAIEETIQEKYGWLFERIIEEQSLSVDETEADEEAVDEEAGNEIAGEGSVQENEEAEGIEEAEGEIIEELPADGIYVIKVSAKDSSENIAEKTLLALLDVTAPQIEGLSDKTVYQDDVNAEPSYDLTRVTVTDNLDGEISVDDCLVELELTDENNHKYVLRITATDSLGNEAIEERIITVKKRETPAPAAPATPAAPAEPAAPSPEPTPAQPSPEPAPADPGAGFNDEEWNNWFWYYEPEAPDSSSFAQQVLDLVNAERINVGLSPLSMNYDVLARADIRAIEIDGYFSHTRPDGTSCFTALSGISYSAAGENIAAGQRSPSEVVTAWMNSDGHRANILNPAFTQIGIGFYYNPNSLYQYNWVQLFIG